MNMATSESPERLLEHRRFKRGAIAPPVGSILREEAMVRLGLGRLEALALGEQDLVITRSPDDRFHVDFASLEAFGAGLGPGRSL